MNCKYLIIVFVALLMPDGNECAIIRRNTFDETEKTFPADLIELKPEEVTLLYVKPSGQNITFYFVQDMLTNRYVVDTENSIKWITLTIHITNDNETIHILKFADIIGNITVYDKLSKIIAHSEQALWQINKGTVIERQPPPPSINYENNQKNTDGHRQNVTAPNSAEKKESLSIATAVTMTIIFYYLFQNRYYYL